MPEPRAPASGSRRPVCGGDRHAAGRAAVRARRYGPLTVAGFITRPRKRIVPDSRSRMANTNGRSTTREGGRLVTPTPTDVAAAASVPSSFTSTKALCMTSVMHSAPLGFMRVKSARCESQNADGIPSACSTAFIVRPYVSVNFGRNTSKDAESSPAIQALHCSPVNPWTRSEEHTSELQSQSNLVCRLLLEKKKNIDTQRQSLQMHVYLSD